MDSDRPAAPGLSGRSAPLLTGAGVLLLYLAFPSRYHNFDGVACAIAVELGDFRHLVHGNHLLYGPVAWAFHSLLVGLGLKLGAVWSLQLLDSLLGAAGAALFHGLLLRAGIRPRAALAAALGLALSYGFWFWSLEAQVYLLGAVFLILSLRESLRPEPSPYRLAVWHGLAMLAHGANALFAPVAVWSLWRNGGHCSASRRPWGTWAPRDLTPREATARYLVAAAAIVAAGYAAAGALWVQPRDAAEAGRWLLGSAALGPAGAFEWQGSGGLLIGGAQWLKGCLDVVSPLWWLALPLWAAAAWSLRGAAGTIPLPAVPGANEAPGTPGRPGLVSSCWLWLGSYALLFLFWQPSVLVYRVSDLVPLWLLGAAAMDAVPRVSRARLLPWAFTAALGLGNLWAAILPASRPESNAALQNALWLRAATPEESWIAAAGVDEVYLPYFAGRRTVDLRFYARKPGGVAARLWEVLQEGRPVYVTSETLRISKDLPPFMDLREEGRRRGVTLYRIRSVAE